VSRLSTERDRVVPFLYSFHDFNSSRRPGARLGAPVAAGRSPNRAARVVSVFWFSLPVQTIAIRPGSIASGTSPHQRDVEQAIVEGRVPCGHACESANCAANTACR
jgi:hypothetical protein